MAEIQVVECGEDIPTGESRVFDVAGRAVAVFNVDGTLFAIDDHCPHRGASLGEGRARDGVVRCPWHKWEFDLETGRCIGKPGTWVRRHEVAFEGGRMQIRLAENATGPGDGVYRFLVRFGAMGWIQRFGTIDPPALARGDCVVVETERGTELGQLLAIEGDAGPQGEALPQPTGELLRPAKPEEIAAWRADCRVPEELLDQAQSLLDELGLGQAAQIIDGERLCDSARICLYVLGDLPENADALNQRLSAELRATVTLHTTAEPPAPAEGGGCGSGGCGSGGCCS